MFLYRTWWRALATGAALVCATTAAAAPATTTIQDVLYKADGTRFNGTLTITWEGFATSDNTMIPAQGLSINVVNGMFRAQLAPTTTASAGANYLVKYSSQGKFQFSEYWAVPPSATALRIADVRVATGSVVGPPPVLTQVEIADVNHLTEELAARPLRGSGFNTSRAAVINAAGQIDAAAGNLGDCLHVDGTSGPCGSGGSTGSSIAFVDAEVPSGLVNGTNTAFTLTQPPAPASSLTLFRNGLLMRAGTDYTLSGNTVTFFTVSVPQAGDLLLASYRYIAAESNQPVVTDVFVDAETPAGTINGTNAQFTLTQAPLPASSLALYRNGLMMRQGGDYTLSGQTITFIGVPQPGDILVAYYRYPNLAAGLAFSAQVASSSAASGK
jgi:hypothetical protein